MVGGEGWGDTLEYEEVLGWIQTLAMKKGILRLAMNGLARL
jgi:hypothetical protein